MFKNEDNNQVFLYSLGHFLVDFACAYLMFSYLRTSDAWYTIILLYNFCAFAMQMPLGLLADFWNRNSLTALSGIFFVFFGAVFLSLSPQFTGTTAVFLCVAIGIGNALYHVGAGLDVLNVTGKKAGLLGVFVSPGALGLYFGAFLGKGHFQEFTLTSLVCLSLFFIAAILFFFQRKTKKSFVSNNCSFSLPFVASSNSNTSKTSNSFVIFGSSSGTCGYSAYIVNKIIFTAVFCLFTVVLLRSYIGLNLNFSWNNTGYWGFILVCSLVLGKTWGGFLMDKIGLYKASVLTLSTSAILFLSEQFLSQYNVLLGLCPILGVLALFSFNMTMPVTLWTASQIMKGAKGFSFGILSFALFIGMLPSYYSFPQTLPKLYFTAGFTVFSLILLLLGCFSYLRLETLPTEKR